MQGHPLQSTKPTFDFAHPTVKKEAKYQKGILKEASITSKDSVLTSILCDSFTWSPKWDMATADLGGTTTQTI